MNNPELRPETYSAKEKRDISKTIKEITKEEAIKDLLKLRDLTCDDVKQLPVRSFHGTDFIYYHVYPELLNTRTAKNISFYEFLENIDYFMEKPYIHNLYDLERERIKNGTHPNKVYKSIFGLHFGSVNIFKPWVAMDLYCKYKPKCILDFTAGWGSRMVGAACLGIDYIGIDLNKKMVGPYKNMINMLRPYSNSKITMINQDATKVDYSKLHYDFVFTSPPYYNVEIYSGTSHMSKEEWNNQFYIPVFTETYKYLKRGGYWCINVPHEIYKNVCIPLLGAADKKVELKKNSRNSEDKYKEYIYIWHKTA